MTLAKLQPYDITKVMENMLKTGFKLYKQEDGISCVPAEKYRCELQFVVIGTSWSLSPCRARFRKYVEKITT